MTLSGALKPFSVNNIKILFEQITPSAVMTK